MVRCEPSSRSSSGELGRHDAGMILVVLKQHFDKYVKHGDAGRGTNTIVICESCLFAAYNERQVHKFKAQSVGEGRRSKNLSSLFSQAAASPRELEVVWASQGAAISRESSDLQGNHSKGPRGPLLC